MSMRWCSPPVSILKDDGRISHRPGNLALASHENHLFNQVLGRSFLSGDARCFVSWSSGILLCSSRQWRSKANQCVKNRIRLVRAARIRGSKILESCAMVSEAFRRMQTKMLRDN